MLSKVLVFVILAFAALGAIRFAAAPPRPRWVRAAIVGIAVTLPLLVLKMGGAGLLAGALAAGAYYFREPGARLKAGPQSAEPALNRARRLLGVPAEATEQDIRAAHRRKIASAHPDRGGSAAAAAQLNAARDLLLRALRTKS